MKKLLHSHTITLLLRIVIIYAALMLIRIVYVIYNYDLLGPVTLAELPDLLGGSLLFDTANICYTFGLFIILNLLPVSPKILAKKWFTRTSFILFLVGVVAICILNLSDAVYFHYARKRISFEEFHFLSNDNTLKIFFRSIWENWHMVLLCFAFIGGLMFLYRLTKPSTPSRINPILYYGCKILLFTLAIGGLIVGMRGGIRRDTRPITISNAAAYATTPAKASIALSNPFCILRTAGNKKLDSFHFFDDSTANALYSPLHIPVKDSLFGSQKGKNLVIVVLESFSAEHSRFLYPDLYSQTLTPFLDSLMATGYTFTNAYANGSKSIDALPSILSSIPSLGIPFATLPAALSPMDGLGNYFESQGYNNWFFNGSPSGSMGYSAYARLAGIHNFRSMEDFEKLRGTEFYDGFWGIWDGDFLDYFAEELNAIKQPFFASIFTLTSHHPFVVPQNQEQHLPEGFTKIHKPVAYVDRSIRDFMHKSSKMPWYKNSVFLFVADHVSSETYSDYARTPKGNTHITYFIYTPDNSLCGVDSTVTQQIDIKPTLFHLFGNTKPYHAFGRNTLSDSSSAMAVNFNSGMYQLITSDSSYLFSAETLRSDSTNSVDINRLKAFMQSYSKSVEENNFTFDKKNSSKDLEK